MPMATAIIPQLIYSFIIINDYISLVVKLYLLWFILYLFYVMLQCSCYIYPIMSNNIIMLMRRFVQHFLYQVHIIAISQKCL